MTTSVGEAMRAVMGAHIAAMEEGAREVRDAARGMVDEVLAATAPELRPTTVSALRHAVASILAARGEDTDALRVTLETMRGSWRIETRGTNGGHPLAVLTYGSSAEAAVARIWTEIVERIDKEDDAAETALRRSEVDRLRAAAALGVVRPSMRAPDAAPPARKIIVAMVTIPDVDQMSLDEVTAHRKALRVELQNVEAMLRERPHQMRPALPVDECRAIIKRKDDLLVSLRRCNDRIKEHHLAEGARRSALAAQTVARMKDPLLDVPVQIIAQLLDVIALLRGGAALTEEQGRRVNGAAKWLTMRASAVAEAG